MYTIESRIFTVSYTSRILGQGMVIIEVCCKQSTEQSENFKRKSHSDAMEKELRCNGKREYFRCVIRYWIAKK
jgi:hypothetical protein